jgi:predicted RNase H-like HicB family nuclease
MNKSEIDQLIRRYPVKIFYDEIDNDYIAVVLDVEEYEHTSAFGDTQEQALKELRIVLESDIKLRVEKGIPIPKVKQNI